MSRTPDINLQVVISLPVDRVFQAWINPELLKLWLTRDANVQPVVGGAYEMFWEPGNPSRNSTLGCRISSLVPNSEISFNWKGAEEHAKIMGESTRVHVRLEDQEGATLLRFVHTGWGAGPVWEKAWAWQEESWKSALENLKNMLENTDRFMQNVSMN